MEKQVEKWRDGEPMICFKCEQEILQGQSYYASNTQSKADRSCQHLICAGGTVAVIGDGQTTIFTQ